MNIEYDEISPITGNLCVVVEADPKVGRVSYLCMESGYTTTDLLQEGSEYLENHEAQLTELMTTVRYVDKETRLVWYPTFMQMPGGMLYPDGSQTELKWKVANVIPVPDEEKLQYPVPGKEGEYFTSKLDVDNANIYDKTDFKLALEDLYDIVKEAIDHETKLRDNSVQ